MAGTTTRRRRRRRRKNDTWKSNKFFAPRTTPTRENERTTAPANGNDAVDALTHSLTGRHTTNKQTDSDFFVFCFASRTSDEESTTRRWSGTRRPINKQITQQEQTTRQQQSNGRDRERHGNNREMEHERMRKLNVKHWLRFFVSFFK